MENKKIEDMLEQILLEVNDAKEEIKKLNQSITVKEVEQEEKLSIALDTICWHRDIFTEHKRRFIHNEKKIDKNSDEIYILKNKISKIKRAKWV